MRTTDGEPNLNRSCEPVTKYPFRVARNIAGNLEGKRVDGCLGGYLYISVTQGEMLVDNLSSVDHAIEVTRNDLDLTRTGDHYAAEWGGRNGGNVPRRKSHARECRCDSDPFLKTSAYQPRWFSLSKNIRGAALRQLIV